MLEKYGTYEKINDTHHHETVETKNSEGVVMVTPGLKVPSDYSITFFDSGAYQTARPVKEVTNYQYEEKIQENKRNIFLLKPDYLPVILDDMEDLMPYRKGSTQYVSETLKRADNIRLYD